MKQKRIIVVSVIIICLSVLGFIGKLPYIVSRISSSFYIALNYPTEGFKFHSAEYAHGFGDYSVHYNDKDGSTQGLSLMMFPKEFPIFIRYDSIKGQG